GGEPDLVVAPGPRESETHHDLRELDHIWLTSFLRCRVGLHKHAEFLARVVGFLGDELAQPDGPLVLDKATAAALGPGVLKRGRVVRVLLTVPDVVHALVSRDLPPATRHVVQPPGVGLPGPDL